MEWNWASWIEPATGFRRFGIEHFIPLAIFAAGTWVWIQRARNRPSPRQYRSAFIFSLVLSTSVFISMIIRALAGFFDVREDLPFHLCNILALLFPVALYFQLRWFFGILYFWVLTGTLQALITPDLKEPFPHFIYMRYWLIHCGLISMILYGLVVLRWKIAVRDIGNAIIGANVYLVFSLLINWLTGGNYFFTMRKPDAGTLLDYLGPWPWYLLTGQFAMLFFFILYYLPVRYLQRGKGEFAMKETEQPG
ncbi:MAG: TIGR02206 family membrane protein [Saprospiraceae bacterium]|nr:TIGR02206 family membrane protein [Saprospiraceae bacterium]